MTVIPPPEKKMDAPVMANEELYGTILFVDDEENILSSLRRLMRNKPFKCLFSTSAIDGLKLLDENKVDIIISDMRMPQMNGDAFLEKCRQQRPNAVRILLTGHSDNEATIRALNRGGIYRYLSKPWDDQELLDIIEQGLKIRKLEREKLELVLLTKKQNEKLVKFNEELEKKVVSRTEEIKQTADMLELVYIQLQDSYSSFIKLFSSVISCRQHLDRSHSNKVAELSQKIALSMKLPSDEVKSIYQASLLMDLGKLNLSDEILKIPEEKIPFEKRNIFEKHPLLAEVTLSSIPELGPTSRLIRSHMESYDGSGFPDHLTGNAIPLGSRIIRIARDFVGLQTGNLKDISLGSFEAINTIKIYSGKKYDSQIIKNFEPLAKEFSIGEEYANEIKVDTFQLQPGMVVSRDIHNSSGILMIAKDFKLNQNIIEKLISLNETNEKSLQIFVYRGDHDK